MTAPRSASTRLIPTTPVEVAIWSLGSYRLKGVSELMQVGGWFKREGMRGFS